MSGIEWKKRRYKLRNANLILMYNPYRCLALWDQAADSAMVPSPALAETRGFQ